MEARPPLSISFHNFYRRFDARTDFLTRALADRFAVTITDVGADIQFSSVFGREQLPTPKGGKPPLRVWWTGEARDPQWQAFDLYFAFWPNRIMGKRWHRLPLWVTYLDWWTPNGTHAPDRLLRPRGEDIASRPRFCNFTFSAQPSVRTEFFMRLNAARGVDSHGLVLNNAGLAGGGRSGKVELLARSRFGVAFENVTAPGYVTEKILEPLLAGTIPIYWGAEEARSDFNPAAFVYANDFNSMDDLVAHVLRLDDSPDALREMTAAPAFPGNAFRYEHTPAFFVDRIVEALESGFRPTAGLMPGPWTTRSEKHRLRLGNRLRQLRRLLPGGGRRR